MYRELPVRTWGQFVDPDRVRGLDPLRANDCGEECASMLLMYWRSIELSAFEIRLEMPGHAHDARTTAEDISNWLRRQHIAADAVHLEARGVRPLIHDQVGHRRPGCILGEYVAPGHLHWIVYRGAGDGHVGINDPWFDQYRKASWGWLLQRYAGALVTTRS